MKLLAEHRASVRACSRCFPFGGNTPVVERPKESKILLVGQAPGSTEVRTRSLFTGPAGKRLMSWFERTGVSREEVYLSALCRCFPGKAKGGGDLVPSRAKIRNCGPHLLREFALLRPRIVVPVGGLAVKELLRVTRLSEAVGRKFERDGVVYIPLIYTPAPPFGGLDVAQRRREQGASRPDARSVRGTSGHPTGG